MPVYPDIVKNFQKMYDYKDSKCFTTPNGNLFCYSNPLLEGDPRATLVLSENGFDGEIHFDPVDSDTFYFTMKKITRISDDTAMITFADNNYRVGNKTRTTYEITDKFEFDAIVEKFDSFIAKCNNYEGTSVTIVQYLGEIQTVFKGEPPNPLTIISSEGLYGFKFREENAYIVFAEKIESRFTIPLCVPTYHSFPSFVQGLNSVKEGFGNFGNQSSGNPYEILTEEEKNKLEKIYEEESELRKIEIETTEQTRNLILGLITVGVIGGIVTGAVLFIRWRKRKRKLEF